MSALLTISIRVDDEQVDIVCACGADLSGSYTAGCTCGLLGCGANAKGMSGEDVGTDIAAHVFRMHEGEDIECVAPLDYTPAHNVAHVARDRYGQMPL